MLRPDPAPDLPSAGVDDDVVVAPAAPPTPFLLAMRRPGWAWWRPVAGLALLAFLAGIAVVLVRVVTLLTGVRPDAGLPAGADWRSLLLTAVPWALAVPAVLLAWPLAHGTGPGPGLSAAGRFRWPLLRRAAVLALLSVGPALGLAVAAAVLLADRELPGPVGAVGWVLLVAVLLVPLQAAGEEFLFRGYLAQSVAAWTGRPRLGAALAALGSAVAWAALHGTDHLGGFLARVALGLLLSALVALTGGLEAAVALHAVVALLVMVLTALLGEGAVPGTAGSAPGEVFVLVSAVGVLVFAALATRRRSAA
ncbi:hypothetical protein DQ241_12360 [Blastococcus sp. TF02A-30]|nr:hypothetical protein DQ241_12360 [Blastococcus sp. TF02A-30]